MLPNPKSEHDERFDSPPGGIIKKLSLTAATLLSPRDEPDFNGTLKIVQKGLDLGFGRQGNLGSGGNHFRDDSSVGIVVVQFIFFSGFQTLEFFIDFNDATHFRKDFGLLN